METKSSFTFVMLSPQINISNLVVGGQDVKLLYDSKWKFVFSESEKKHYWVTKVVVNDIEQVLSFPAVISCESEECDVLITVPKVMKLLSFEEISEDFTPIAVDSVVFFAESEEYLGTFVLSEYFHIQELKRV